MWRAWSIAACLWLVGVIVAAVLVEEEPAPPKGFENLGTAATSSAGASRTVGANEANDWLPLPKHTAAALADDDACLLDGEESCTLFALQTRGRKQIAALEIQSIGSSIGESQQLPISMGEQGPTPARDVQVAPHLLSKPSSPQHELLLVSVRPPCFCRTNAAFAQLQHLLMTPVVFFAGRGQVQRQDQYAGAAFVLAVLLVLLLLIAGFCLAFASMRPPPLDGRGGERVRSRIGGERRGASRSGASAAGSAGSGASGREGNEHTFIEGVPENPTRQSPPLPPFIRAQTRG
eukprot:CAMPEP_0115303544 /NCGR_PEP_ID=MMETSP0270-20121206/70977_1 /TAXON_ID=71861 /ORGANISM="Scrippsiella trochoidea, Strain CCMP3099" /LENGTH=290 /DNA_ID=CAMNT_0002721553 /DNA_START=149 /DNA_END=1018 /DNA_ORIENTATION=+